ncbi:MAG: ABC transporter permease [Candidatus Tectomicrobia bacterium]|nr:ABC transporter permease [Candidatus Tectomicrobia bacterium]MBI2132635.1 ABC transporter permease [Candidatus Tectomicrobia bacterium]MBI2178242.1 ABC transporter permease [Candidatus Tectomicrobia bacterium]
MRAYVIRRLLQSLIVLKAVLLIVFFMLQITGDPAGVLMPIDSTQEDLAKFRRDMGFDQPMHVQYYHFLFGRERNKGVLRGDFGFSFRHEVPAMGLVLEHLPATVQLAVVAVVISLVLAIPAGILSATFRNSWIDHVSSVGSMFGQSMPNFWLGLMLIIIFAVKLRWLPTSGYEGPEYIILPALTAGLYATARIMRVMRSQMLEVLGLDYVRTARSKGLNETLIVVRHALKNASIPVVTIVGIELGILLGGTVVTEAVFAWPGVGFLTVDAINNQDYPVVQAAVALLAFMFVGVNLAVDLLYAWLDPRISYK